MSKRQYMLIISPFFAPHIGGSQRYMEELAATLVKTNRDIAVDVLTYNTTGASTHENYRGMTIYRVGCVDILPGQFVLPNPFALIALLIRLARHQYTVVWANTRFFDTTWWGWIYARMIGATSIVTDHVAGHPVHKHPVITWVAAIIDKTICRLMLHRYDVVTATNKATQTFLRATLGIPDVVLSYGGVDTQYFSPVSREIRTIPGVPKRFNAHDTIITFASRLIWSKGVTYFLEAVIQLLSKVPSNVYVVLAGTGDLEKTVRAVINKNELSHRVFVTGGLNPQSVRKTLRASNIVVHPSHHTEGFPNIILEAGACQACIIATDKAGTKEIISHNKTGLLIPQKNSKAISSAIMWALSHKKQCQTMAQLARRHIVSHFDWKRVAADFRKHVLPASSAGRR